MTRGVARPKTLVALATVALLSACVAPRPLADGVDASGRRLVLVLDRSTSMRDNDPDGAARTGVDLALALVGARDNVAVVSFAEDADVVVPLRPAGGTASRSAMRSALDGLERQGVSDVGRALDTAREVLEAGDAPRGSSVVFLTDGVPYRQARGRRLADGPSTDEAVQALAARGYKIFAIALGRGASTPFLSRLVASTGGAVIVARDAGELVTAFESVAVEALGYLRAERAASLTVLPHTKRVAFLGRWEGAGSVGAVARDGAAVPDAELVRTPSSGSGPFGVALLEAPEPGTWTAELALARETVQLVEPGFSIDFLAGTPAAVPGGGEVPVTIGLSGDPDLVAKARERLTLRVRLERDGATAGADVGAWTSLALDQTARLAAPVVTEETVARVVVEVEVVLGGRAFQLRRTRALTIQPGAGEAVTVAPTALAPLELVLRSSGFQRVVWEGDALDPVRFSLRGDPTRAARVRCAGVTLDLAAGATGILQVPCPERGGLVVTAEAEGAAPFRAELTGVVRRLRLAPASLTLPATPAGVDSAPAPLDLALEPSGRVVVAPGPVTLVGPAGHEVAVERTDAGFVARPGADAPAGRYRGALVVVVEEPRGLRSRDLPLDLEVLAPVRTPASIDVQGAWGWVSCPVEVAWPSLAEVAVSIAPGLLTGEAATIHPDLDIRVVPLDGWSGERLSHEPRRFALQVFLSSDLPAGLYRGVVDLTGDGRAVSIPVALEVRR